MSFTYATILTEMRYMVRDNNGTYNWDDPVLFIIALDGAELIYKRLCQIAPDMFSTTSNINLTVLGSYGPYNLPSDLSYILSVRDTNNKIVELSNDEELVTAADKSGEPKKYWTKGWNPPVIYFDRVPDQAYAFPVKYVPVFTRASVNTENVPLPDGVRSALRAWVEKIAGIIDEYNTMDEQQKLEILLPMITDDTFKRRNKIKLKFSGVGF